MLLLPSHRLDFVSALSCAAVRVVVVSSSSQKSRGQGRDLVPPNGNNSTDKLRGFNNDFVVGLNCYQNAWPRMFFDYERELVDFVDNNVPNTQANIFGVRWQIDW